jgi:hypothetical protein
MRQISAILRYELLMAWRRRSLPILWMLLLAGVIGFAFIIESNGGTQPIVDQAVAGNMGANTPAWAQGIDLVEAGNTFALINILIAGMIFYSVGVTLMMGETIPLDRQFKVRELLDTLPLSRTAYLGGKLFSAWAGLLLGIIIVGAICALAIRLILGVYDVRVFLAMWAVMLVPSSFVASALSLLSSSPFSSRRTAVLVGLAIIPIVLTLVSLGVPSFAGVGALIQPIYALGILLVPGDESAIEIRSRIVNTLAVYALVLISMWTFAWLNARRREIP